MTSDSSEQESALRKYLPSLTQGVLLMSMKQEWQAPVLSKESDFPFF